MVIDGERKQRRRWLNCGTIILFLFFLVGLILLIMMGFGFSAVAKSAKTYSYQPYQQDNSNRYTLSTDQNELIQNLGYPDSFILLFYDEPGPDGESIPIRNEMWTYYSRGEEYSFINGVAVGMETFETEAGSLVPAEYRPEQFVRAMTLDDLLAAAGAEEHLEIPMEKEVVEDGVLYFTAQLTFGLKDGLLRYLETIAIEIGEKP